MINQDAQNDVSHDQEEFLVFSLGDEDYGVNILKVQEIRRYENITKIANTPHYVKGVTNLRGNIVPIIDLRLKFNMENAEFNDHTVVIVVNCLDKVVGFVVDRVLDVMSVDKNNIQAPPEHAMSTLSNFIVGLVTVEDRMNILIDVEKMITEDEVGKITEEA